MNESSTYMLHKLVFMLDRAADEMLRKHFGISYNRALVLVTLREMPGATQHQLALALSYTDAAVSLMLGELIKAGFVSVTIDPAHRRKKRVELTAEGVRLADKTHAFLSQKFDNFMAASSIDVAQFNKMITQLYGAAKEQS